MLKKQNGITLIALIITVIVMLILVGVTINVALNGGLFEKAETAKEGTQKAADEEELQLEIVTAYNEKTGELDLSILKTNLENKDWKNVTISGDKLTCTSPKGNTFTVDEYGRIESENEEEQKPQWGYITYDGNTMLCYIGTSTTAKITNNDIEAELMSVNENDEYLKTGIISTIKVNECTGIGFLSTIEYIDLGDNLNSNCELALENIIDGGYHKVKEIKGLGGMTHLVEFQEDLESIVIPESVETIEGDCFRSCKNLTNIVIQKEEGAFSDEELKSMGFTDEQISNIKWEPK